MTREASRTFDRAYWVAVTIAVLLLAVIIGVMILVPGLTTQQQWIMHLVMSIDAGMFAFPLGGRAILEVKRDLTDGARARFSATAGVAVFLAAFYLLEPPEVPQAIPPPPSTPLATSTESDRAGILVYSQASHTSSYESFAEASGQPIVLSQHTLPYLHGYRCVIINWEKAPSVFAGADIQRIVEYIETGGTLIAVTENHSTDLGAAGVRNSDRFNLLASDLGAGVRDTGALHPGTRNPQSTTLVSTDILTEGVHKVRYARGTTLAVDGQSAVTLLWSSATNGSRPLMAVRRMGDGEAVFLADSNMLSDRNFGAFKTTHYDNLTLARNLCE